jgi:hypothetical protein
LQAGLLFLATIGLLVPSAIAEADSKADSAFTSKLSVGLAVLLIDGSPILAGRRGDDAHIGPHRFAGDQQRPISLVRRRARPHGLLIFALTLYLLPPKGRMIGCPKVPWRLAVSFGSFRQ